MPSWDLIVVGGGIVGASAAYHAARAGARVLVADRGDEGRATAAGAGIVSPETDLRRPGAYLDLGRRAADAYPGLLDALPVRAGWERCGMLVVAADDDEVRAFDAFADEVLARERGAEAGDGSESRGAPGDLTLRTLEPAAARELFPPLQRIERALWNPRAARVDGREVTAALHAGALACGAERVVATAEVLLGAGGAIEGAIVGGERQLSPAVVVAAGAWSAALLAKIGVRLDLAPQRGQIAHLALEQIETGSWPMVSGFRDHYLVAWPGGRVAAGATRETGSGFDPRATAAGVREVLTEALRLAPGLAAATLIEVRVGLRPLAADGLPILGPVRGRPGLWLATGHGPAGLTLGPYSAKLVAEAALGGEWPAELAAFSPDRFS